MTAPQWVDALPPVTSPGHAGPREVIYLFPESSPVRLESLSVGTTATAQLGGREVPLTKTKRWGKPWLDPQTNESLTNARAAQLGFL